ncbi:MAG: ATP-binding protein [Clostridiales Family XIII bacterium]|jgi:AAA+ ATPase superfamily predicted ATPase|nr:ATP-binding protein [Clostridiales Family XIII bacterium]
MFIGRERELNKLNELYRANSFQFPVIYGRRRVGKTALINEFIKDKDAMFFTGIESNAQQNLENFSRSILSFTDAALENTVFSSFQEALEYVFRIAEKKRIILVIDEYPYIAKASKSLASTLQSLIDKNKDTSNLFLVLCGSSMSFMENHVLAYTAPLYGRRTAQLKILPFDFFESMSYFREFSDLDMASIYGMVGGTPQYLLQMNDRLTLEENIKRCFLDPSSPLFEEPNNLLKQEVREPAVYNAIIAAIAAGSTKLSEISSKAGEETSACAAYMKNLISLGIIKKETPFAENSKRKTIYRIDDNLFRFWYRFVPDNIASINRGLTDAVYKKMSPLLNDYMGTVFEDICVQYLWKLRKQGKIEIEFTDLGRWWGNDAKNKCEAEIDIMGTDGTDSALFCECKWTNEKVDIGVLDVLLERSRLFHYKNVRLYVFAKIGFTKGCADKANELGNVKLVAFDEIVIREPKNERGE